MSAYLDYSTAGQTPNMPLPINSTRNPATTDTLASAGQPYVFGQVWVNRTSKAIFFYAGGSTWLPFPISASGNLAFTTAGNKITTPAASNTTAAGANSFGTVTLVSGTATVATTSVTASSLIFLSRMSIGASTALGNLTVGTVTGGTSFVINAATSATPATPVAGDLSVVAWMIVN